MEKNEYLELMKSMFSKSKEEINEMYNSGRFNDITEGFMVRVLKNLDASEEFIEQAVLELHCCHDICSAGEVRV